MAATSEMHSPDRRPRPAGLRDPPALVHPSRGLDEVLGYLVMQAQHVLGADGVALYLRDEMQPDLLHVAAACGVPDNMLSPSLPVGAPIIGLAVTRQRMVVAADFPSALR